MDVNGSSQGYSLKIDNRLVTVPTRNAARAARIDANHDCFLSQSELQNAASGSPELSLQPGAADRAKELACSLAAVPNSNAAGYHDFSSLIGDFDKLAKANPEYVQKVDLGKTPEGRDVWGYKLSEGAQGDTSAKPGVVITGCHHAREWMTVEAPLQLAHDLLDNIKSDPAKQQRLHDGEIWILPCVNPDGYEYSRTTDNMWRKNRDPLKVDQLGHPTGEVGVDLNRNYGDDNPDHSWIFRPAGDVPGNTGDDFGATSDDPSSDCYRGPSAHSEPEIQAVESLESRPNIRAAVDYHSYGNDILYPWSHTAEHAPHYDLYNAIGDKIAKATGYTLDQSSGLYPNSGSSDEYAEANGMLSFTFEMGQSFQPDPSLIPEVAGKAAKGATVFIDEVLSHVKDGTLAPKAPLSGPAPVAEPGGRVIR